jgi:hypothetical protein
MLGKWSLLRGCSEVTLSLSFLFFTYTSSNVLLPAFLLLLLFLLCMGERRYELKKFCVVSCSVAFGRISLPSLLLAVPALSLLSFVFKEKRVELLLLPSFIPLLF